MADRPDDWSPELEAEIVATWGEYPDLHIWLAVPCACVLCATRNMLAATTYFIHDNATDKPVGLFCVTHGPISTYKNEADLHAWLTRSANG